MNFLRKTLNRYNGNLCFLAESDFYRYIFECDRYSQQISYDTTSQFPKDVCNNNVSSYFVCYGSDQIGMFDGSTLNDSYKTSPVNIDRIVSGNEYFYVWSATENAIIKLEVGLSVTEIWRYDLPLYFNGCEDVEIFYKKSNDTIILKGNGYIITLQDLGSEVYLFGEISVGSSNNFVVVSGDNYPEVLYARSREVWGGDLEQTSSSSSSG